MLLGKRLDALSPRERLQWATTIEFSPGISADKKAEYQAAITASERRRSRALVVLVGGDQSVRTRTVELLGDFPADVPTASCGDCQAIAHLVPTGCPLHNQAAVAFRSAVHNEGWLS